MKQKKRKNSRQRRNLRKIVPGKRTRQEDAKISKEEEEEREAIKRKR